MRLLAIDPGPTSSGWVLCEVVDRKVRVLDSGNTENPDLLQLISMPVTMLGLEALVVEKVESYGMPVGEAVFGTVFWSGRFVEAAIVHHHAQWDRLGHKAVKMHLCGSMRAKEPHIRQVVLDRFGSVRTVAIGTIKARGPLYGVKAHAWSALALAVTWAETSTVGAAATTSDAPSWEEQVDADRAAAATKELPR